MKIFKVPEKMVMISVMLLMATGLVFIYSVSGPYSYSKELSGSYYFLKQLVWSIIALTALFICSKINYRKFLKLSPFFIIAAIILLIWVLFTPTQLGVHRWLSYGFFRFQPSEVFKISLLMYLAYILIDKKGKPKEIQRILPHLAIAVIGILLIAKQPDLGTMMLIFSATVTLLFLIGLKIRYIISACLAVLIFGGVMVFYKGYEKDRVEDWYIALKHPLEKPDGSEPSRGYYQNRQSLISIGSGGLGGCGLGGGEQKNLFLPAPHTDFIFSASAEEGGFILCMFILGLLFLFNIGAIKIAQRSTDLQGYLLASGLGLMITLQAVINIGVALGLLPITGITLPFFSYGGSSLVISCAAAGFILSVSRYGGQPRVRYVRAQ